MRSNVRMPRMLMCLCPIGARRLNTSSAWSPGARSIAAWRRWVFQAMTMFASKVSAPEMAPSCSVVFRRDHAVMDGALQAVDGLALVEQIEDFRPEYRVAEVIAEIEGAQQLSQGVTGFIDGIAGGGRAEA